MLIRQKIEAWAAWDAAMVAVSAKRVVHVETKNGIREAQGETLIAQINNWIYICCTTDPPSTNMKAFLGRTNKSLKRVD